MPRLGYTLWLTPGEPPTRTECPKNLNLLENIYTTRLVAKETEGERRILIARGSW